MARQQSDTRQNYILPIDQIVYVNGIQELVTAIQNDQVDTASISLLSTLYEEVKATGLGNVELNDPNNFWIYITFLENGHKRLHKMHPVLHYLPDISGDNVTLFF